MNSILMISPTPTHPATAGNRVRIAALAEAIGRLGYHLDLVYLTRESGDREAMSAAWGNRLITVEHRPARPRRVHRLLRRLGRRLRLDAAYRFGIDDWYEPALDDAVRRLLAERRYAAVIVEYVFLSKALELVPPGTRRILDTHDVFSNRHRMYLEQGRTPAWFSCTPAQEAAALRRADTVVAIKESEASYFRSLTDRPVVTVGHIAPVFPSSCLDAAASRTIAVLGSANAINVQSTRWFLSAVFPEVRARVPDATLMVAGSVCDGLEEAPGVRLLGVVDDVADVYRSAAVVINPMRYGTGLKIKTVEALGYGKAVVTTTVGAEGLEGDGESGFRIADTPREFARAVAQLLEDESARADLERSGRAYLEGYNAAALAQLAGVLGTPAPDTP